MANPLIKPLYEKIYGESFDYGSFGKRMKMQKGIYLIEQFGLNIGEYDFSWYKHGPYSQRLQDDMYEESSRKSTELRYSEYAIYIIGRIKEIVGVAKEKGFKYNLEQWMECLASVHYLNRVFQGNKEKTLQQLVERKPHLNELTANEEAYDIVTSMS